MLRIILLICAFTFSGFFYSCHNILSYESIQGCNAVFGADPIRTHSNLQGMVRFDSTNNTYLIQARLTGQSAFSLLVPCNLPESLKIPDSEIRFFGNEFPALPNNRIPFEITFIETVRRR